MVDVSVTEAEVLPTSTTQFYQGTLGATVTAGQTVYLDSSTDTLLLADADDSSTTATLKGIAMNGGVSGQQCSVATAGDIDPGFTAAAGALYVLSGTAGGIAPVADLATSDYLVIVGWGTSATNLKLHIQNTGVVTA